MKTIPLLLAGLSGLTLAAEPSSPETPPKGLAASDWSSIRAAYEAGRHAVHRQEDGTLTARNPGQQWRTEFDGKGFTVTPDHGQWAWGLELTGYGERTLLASNSITHEGGKIFCQRDENLTEWFINDTRGLEQGWTIHSRSVGSLPAVAEGGGRVSPTSSPLTLTLALRGDLHAQVSPDSSSVSFQTPSGGTALTYGGLKAWDADGTNLIVRFEPAGENAIRIAVEDQNARYPITIDPIAQQAYLKASNTGAGDLFGISVAVSGDTVVVGASGEDSSTTGVNSTPNESASGSGAAYVFTRSGSTWSQQAYLKASNTGTADEFGYSVSVSGDTVVVGAHVEYGSTTGVNSTPNENAPGAGAAYVFTRSGTTWSQQAYLKASNTAPGDSFGISVAVSGDTVVVGAVGEDSSTTGVNSTPNENALTSGAAYVFTRNGTTWSQQAYLKASNTGENDLFGEKVAVSGDTVVVGAYSEDSSTTGVNSTPNNSANSSGAAYVFTRSGTTWSQQAYLKASNTGASDQFGWSVAVSGDTVVVGAPTENSSTTGVNSTPNESATYSGAAYVFTRSGTTWSQQAYLKASNTGADDRFGNSVAVSGDTVVVGAENEGSSTTGVNSTPNETASSSGAAYVFTRSGTTWSQQAYLKASNTGPIDTFGWSVAVSGDTVVVGALAEDSSTTGVNSTPNDTGGSAFNSGAAYVFDLNAVLPIPEIAVQQAGADIATSTTKDFGSLVMGITSDLIFTVFNTGTSDLTLSGTPKVAVTGSSDFTVTAQPASPITGPSGTTTFTVRFAPTNGGPKTASLSIPNNDGDENPFVIHLTGTGTIPPSTNADMGSLSVTEGIGISGPMLDLQPAFSPAITSYQVTVPQDSTAVRITGLVADPSATLFAMGNMGSFGSLNVTHGFFGGVNPYSFSVMAQDGLTIKTYTISFLRSTPAEIAIQQAGADLATTATKTFGPVIAGSTSDLIFTILNTGIADLTLTGTPKVAVSGSSDFTVTAQPADSITGPSGSSNFTVRFTPTGSGLKSASLSIPNNDDNENPFVINLTGTALSFSTDTDNDGLSDASEYNMSDLGFIWNSAQPGLVNTLFANAAGAGLFTTGQVQALNTGTPLIARDPATGKFKLAMDWKKSTNLTNFLDFPAPAGSAVAITPQGDVEFEFPSTDNAAFYRIEVD